MKRFKYNDDDFVCYVLKLLNFRYNKRSSLNKDVQCYFTYNNKKKQIK